MSDKDFEVYFRSNMESLKVCEQGSNRITTECVGKVSVPALWALVGCRRNQSYRKTFRRCLQWTWDYESVDHKGSWNGKDLLKYCMYRGNGNILKITLRIWNGRLNDRLWWNIKIGSQESDLRVDCSYFEIMIWSDSRACKWRCPATQGRARAVDTELQVICINLVTETERK